MRTIFRIILILIVWYLSAYVFNSYAAFTIPGVDNITPVSMVVAAAADPKEFALSFLGVVRVGISGLALIYLVMIGAYMVLASDNEENIKKQRKQITYVIIGFLFLNVPNFVYSIFSWSDKSQSISPGGELWGISGGSLFWDTAWFEGVFGNLVAFLRVFVFGVAVVMFTWWLFNLLISWGDDEKKKMAKNRIIYWLIGLIFMGFVGLWWQMIAGGDFGTALGWIWGTSKVIFWLIMYFVAPISIFMIFWWSYYFITSAGDEERMKKWKSILINTGIAIIILLSAFSFMTDLSWFQF